MAAEDSDRRLIDLRMSSGSHMGWSTTHGIAMQSSSKNASKVQHSKYPPVGNYKEFRPPKDWANAPEFVPKNFKPVIPISSGSSSYADVVGSSSGSFNVPLNLIEAPEQFIPTFYEPQKVHESSELCPYAVVGECRYGDQCLLIHGIRCDYCMQWCIHPFNVAQREAHKKECIRQHERDMELSFAVAQSTEKTCGICMEVVVDKTPVGEQRFGILPSCNHCFCLSCIRRWRQARQFENKIIRACPECRITSDFVCPSRFWVETKQEKDKLIGNYKIALSNKACRYYRTGAGTCPFGNKCFYLHALPNGTKVDVGPPRRRPRRETESGVSSGDNEVSIWEFLEDWELQWMDIDDFMDMIDSDGSLSDPEFQESELSDIEDLYISHLALGDTGFDYPYREGMPARQESQDEEMSRLFGDTSIDSRLLHEEENEDYERSLARDIQAMDMFYEREEAEEALLEAEVERELLEVQRERRERELELKGTDTREGKLED